MYEKGYIWNPATCCSENGNFLRSITDDFVIMCDEIINRTKTVPTKTFPTKSTSTNFYILLACLLINIALLVAASIYYLLLLHKISSKPKSIIQQVYHVMT